jgi:hypothetical protein
MFFSSAFPYYSQLFDSLALELEAAALGTYLQRGVDFLQRLFYSGLSGSFHFAYLCRKRYG